MNDESEESGGSVIRLFYLQFHGRTKKNPDKF
jgi:hypothetical protein